MQRLFTIDTEGDLIVICRLINVFRRKGVKLAKLVISSTPGGFRVAVLFEAAESEVEHLFNFVRRMEGVSHLDSQEGSPDLEPLSLVN
jgi:hypothetical protein